ncbi:uncharacterized protein LOC134723605 [Mytilus trossulus]|uniref:uncharacterized protein LOC134723605 n=1 Tax=Mytilus trossulus TaxID=6551 RepID=UPI0030058E9B
MNTDAQIGPNHLHLPAQSDLPISRIRALQKLGGLQISLGVICGILGIVGAILSTTDMDSDCKKYNHYNSYYNCGNAHTIFVLNLIDMAFSGWFILTGCFPLFMTEQRKSSWKCLTIAFLVCNIISAVVFSSTVFSLAMVGISIAAFDNNTGSTGGVITVSAFLVILSFVEFIVAIVAASYCCCCSQLNTGDQQGVIFIDIAQSGMMYNMQNTSIATENQPGNYQMPIPHMQGYYGQQPTILPNNQQQPGHSHGNQMPIQGYYDQQAGNMIIKQQQQPGHSQGNQMPIQG